jgi:hypothetical protein
MKLLPFEIAISRTFLSACLFITLAFVISSTQFSRADEKRRVALVIGNSVYENTTQLKNPKNDAQDMLIALEAIGFDVTKIDNANFSTMRKALRDFGRHAQGADIAMVYFAGHGMEVEKNNYLIPVDAQLVSDQDVEYEAISIELLSRAVSGAKGLRMILLDACRNNPFVNKMSRSISTRAIGRGLAPVEPRNGTLVSYAAREGTTASDGDGRNSPYTKALISHLKEPGLDIRFMFAKVRDSVLAATAGEQEPFMYGSLPGKELYLVPKKETEVVENNAGGGTPAPLPTQPLIVDQANTSNGAFEREYWNSIKDTKAIAYFQSYLDQYPSGKFVPLARIKIGILEQAEAEKQKKIPATIAPLPKDDISYLPQLDEVLRSVIRDFIRSKYLSSTANNANHVRNIYTSEVKYYSKDWIFIEEIVEDKQNYFKRWPKYYYEFVENSDTIEQLTKDSFKISFNSRFELESPTEKTFGTSNTTLTLVAGFGGQFRISSENSKVIKQTTKKTAKLFVADDVTLDPRIIEVGKWLEGFALDGNNLWVAESGQRTLAKVNFYTGEVQKRFKVGRLPVDTVVVGDSTYTLVATDRLLLKHSKSGRKSQLTSLEGCPVKMIASGADLFVLGLPACSSESSRVTRVDTVNGTKKSSPDLGEWANAITATGSDVWVGHARYPAISIVNKAQLTVEKVDLAGVEVWALASNKLSVFAGGRPTSAGIALDDGSIVMVDARSRKEISRYSVTEMVMEITANEDYVVAIGRQGTIWVFSAIDLSLIRTIHSSTGPYDPSMVHIAGNDLIISARTYRGDNGAILVFSNGIFSELARARIKGISSSDNSNSADQGEALVCYYNSAGLQHDADICYLGSDLSQRGSTQLGARCLRDSRAVCAIGNSGPCRSGANEYNWFSVLDRDATAQCPPVGG